MEKIKIIHGALVVLFLFLLLELFNLEIIRGGFYRDLSLKNCIRLIPQEGSRGQILDRDARIIVGNRITYDLLLLAPSVLGADTVLHKTASVLGIEFSKLKKTFKRNFISDSIPTVIVKNIGINKAMRLEESKPDVGNVIVGPKLSRQYHYGSLACQLLGYLNEIDHWRLTKLADYGYQTKDIVGFGGVEEKYDFYLRQQEGGLSVEVDHRGKVTRVLGFKAPASGRDIGLTIDLRIQKIVEESMNQAKASVILMDPYTGEILAMASSPVFDPGIFVEDSSNAIKNVFSDSRAPMTNRAISALYPAGSLFKLVVATAGLQLKKIAGGTSFICSGKVNVGGRDFACWETHQNQDLTQALTHSCNTYFYRAGLLLGGQAIHDYALRFGLSKPTGIDLPYEASGFIPSPLWSRLYKFRNWYDGDTANLSIGQGEVLVTPIQMARMMAVFANRGKLVTPYVLKSVGNRDISRSQQKVTSLSLKESTISAILPGLRAVVSATSGTAHVLNNVGVTVAGKTGTAQAPPGAPHGWFAGFFPYNNPRYVISVCVERGGAGAVACLLAKQIITRMVEEGIVVK